MTGAEKFPKYARVDANGHPFERSKNNAISHENDTYQYIDVQNGKLSFNAVAWDESGKWTQLDSFQLEKSTENIWVLRENIN